MNEKEVYKNFIIVPKQLFCEEKWASLSAHAKLLYSLLLDRSKLSRENGWTDKAGRVYIYYTLKEAMDALSVGKDKAIKVFAELDKGSGCGLIEKKHQGLTKPSKIYVFNPFFEKTDVRESDAQTFKSTKNRPLKVGKTESINNYINNTDFKNTDLIFQSDRERTEMFETIKRNIDFDVLKEKYEEKKLLSLVDMMTDALTSGSKTVLISGKMLPVCRVKDIFLKLDFSHIEYVLDCFYDCHTEPKNIKNYLLAALYNSYNTIDFYYEKKVQKDLFSN